MWHSCCTVVVEYLLRLHITALLQVAFKATLQLVEGALVYHSCEVHDLPTDRALPCVCNTIKNVKYYRNSK